jgi:NADH dehydrogenase
LQDGHPVPGVAPAAIQGGHYAARAIIHELEGKPIESFHYLNKGELATIGRSAAVAMFPGHIKLSGFFAWLSYMMVHLIYLAGLSSRLKVFATWLWSLLTYGHGARLIANMPAEPTGPPAMPAPQPVPGPAGAEPPHAPAHH